MIEVSGNALDQYAANTAATYVVRDGDQMKFGRLRKVPPHKSHPDGPSRVDGQQALERIRSGVVLVGVDRVRVTEPVRE